MSTRPYAAANREESLRQGEILTNVTQSLVEYQADSSERLVYPYRHPFAVVLSQSCDLEWDYRSRTGTWTTQGELISKRIPNVLFCEAMDAERLRQSGINSGVWKRVRDNKDERYQFLQRIEAPADLFNEGLPELGLDFKRYFTIPTDDLYRDIESGDTQRRCVLQSPYAEHLASRFFYFQARIALPEDHFSEPSG